MLFAPTLGDLEIRKSGRGGFRVRGRFPYNRTATLSDGGRNGGRLRKERFAPRAFSYAIEDDREIHFLSGHDFGKPLASRKSGSLILEDSDEALTMEATLAAEIEDTTWGRDFISAHRAGLVVGLSPGFRIPPKTAVPDAEVVEEEDPAEGRALIRTINAAVLFEISAVTRPAYEDAALAESRSWALPSDPPVMTVDRRVQFHRRWR